MNNDSLDFIFRPSGDITQEVTVARMESLRKAAARAQPPDRVIGGTIRTTPDGWILEINQRAVGGTTSFPLQPIKTGENGDEVKFRYGTCGGIVPQIDSNPITADLDDEDNPTLAVTGDGIIYVKVDLAEDTYEAENPVLVFVEGDETDVPDDEDRVSAHFPLVGVSWDNDNSAINTLAPTHQGSIDMASCAGVLNYWDLG